VILETVERVATWLGHATHGVNALLPGVPRIGADAEPPAVAAILNERQHGNAARGHLPADQLTPALLVSFAEDASYDLALEQSVADVQLLVVGIAYAIRDVDSEEAVRHGYYTMVAVRRSLRRLFVTGVAADRTVGTVTLVQPVSLRQSPAWTPIEDVVVTSALLAGYFVRDTAP
jgi:hypothetical protein